MGQTVNLLAYAVGGSNPSLPTRKRMECRLEAQLLGIADAAADADGMRKRSPIRCIFAEVAQLIEH